MTKTDTMTAVYDCLALIRAKIASDSPKMIPWVDRTIAHLLDGIKDDLDSLPKPKHPIWQFHRDHQPDHNMPSPN